MSTKKFILLLLLCCIPEFIFAYIFATYLKANPGMASNSFHILLLFIPSFIFDIPVIAVLLIYKMSYKSKIYNIFDAIKTRNEKSRKMKLFFYVGEKFRSSDGFDKLLNLTYSPVSSIIKINNESDEQLMAKVTLNDNREYIFTFIKHTGKNINRRLMVWVLDKIDGLGF